MTPGQRIDLPAVATCQTPSAFVNANFMGLSGPLPNSDANLVWDSHADTLVDLRGRFANQVLGRPEQELLEIAAL
jgi:hypothetical protein